MFVLFKGYFDESYDGSAVNLFTLSCLVATGKDWFEIERAWKLQLAAKNKQLKKEGRAPISRYHASECSGRRGDFEGWSHDERDTFVCELFGVIKRSRGVHAVAYDMQLDDVCDVFPEWSKDRLETAYAVLPKFVMWTLGEDFQQMARGVSARINLFHDQTGGEGRYDPTISRAFDGQMADPNFPYKQYFHTISPKRWESCVPLQLADLVAFEWYKEADARLEARKTRKSFQALLDMEAFGIHSKSFTKEILQELREHMQSNEK